MTHDDDKATDAKVLLIDDDRELGEMLCDYLAPDRLAVEIALSGEQGLRNARAGRFDLLILDIMLPGMTGLEVLQELRRDSDVPVIMLTARGDDVDRIIGLECGADDYLAKPFNPRELAARIKALLRRSQTAAQRNDSLNIGRIRIDQKSRQAMVGTNKLRLTGTEFEILRCLLAGAGDVVTKEALSERALGRRLLPYDRSIDTHISNLRGKLLRAGAAEETITNQRGVGYMLLAPAE